MNLKNLEYHSHEEYYLTICLMKPNFYLSKNNEKLIKNWIVLRFKSVQFSP